MANLVKNFLTDFENINDYYMFLVDKTKRREYVGITNEWLIDNFYLLVEHKTNIIHDKKYIMKDLKKCSRVFYCLKDIVVRNNFQYLQRQVQQQECKLPFLHHKQNILCHLQ